MDTYKMENLTTRCNRLKDFQVGSQNLSNPCLTVSNSALAYALNSIDTEGIMDQVRDVVQTRIDTLEQEIRELFSNEESS